MDKEELMNIPYSSRNVKNSCLVYEWKSERDAGGEKERKNTILYIYIYIYIWIIWGKMLLNTTHD